MVLDLNNMQRQAAESDAEREFERVMGMPSRDWVAKQVSERTLSAPEAEKQCRRLLRQLGDAYHRRIVEEHAEVADRYGRMVKGAEMARRLRGDA